MKADLFKKVVVPAMGVENTSVFAISTPDNEFNYFSELFELKRKDGTPLFYLIMVGLACKQCMDAGMGHECMHMLKDLPPWKSAARQEVMKAILANDPETFMRENQGMVVSGMRFIYQKYRPAFLKRKPFTLSAPPTVGFVFIDTAGGGSLSDHAVVSGCHEAGRDVVCFLFVFQYHHIQ